MTTVQETSNKATLTRIEEALSSGDWELISKTIDEVVAPDAQISTPLPIEATGFPDLHVTIEDLDRRGRQGRRNKFRYRRTPEEYMGLPPTGNSVTYNEVFICRFADGRLAENLGNGRCSLVAATARRPCSAFDAGASLDRRTAVGPSSCIP